MGGSGSIPNKHRTWLLQPSVSSSRVRKDGGVKPLWTLPQQLRTVSDARCVGSVLHHGGPEKPLYKSVNVEAGMCWITPGVKIP